MLLKEIDKDVVFNLQVAEYDNSSRIMCYDPVDSGSHVTGHHSDLLFLALGFTAAADASDLNVVFERKDENGRSSKENCQITDHTIHSFLS